MDGCWLSAQHMEVGAIAAEVIRKWYPTICYELCLPQPEVRISYDEIRNRVGSVILGRFASEDWSITVFVDKTNRRRGSYLFTLAHEARHAWQTHNREPATEADCDEWAAKFLRRHKTGPVCDPYPYRIVGEPSKCPDGHTMLCGYPCRICIELEQKAARERQLRRLAELEDMITSAIRFAARVRFVPQRLLDAKRASRRERKQMTAKAKWQDAIDHHPDNGKQGCWLVDGRFYVNARSAGEAIIKVADQLDSSLPKVAFVGKQPPPK